MLTVRSEEFVRFEDGKAVVRAVLEVASPEEIPTIDGIEGRILHQGSLAWDVTSGEVYALSSGGTWSKQPKGTASLAAAVCIAASAKCPVPADLEGSYADNTQ